MRDDSRILQIFEGFAQSLVETRWLKETLTM